MRKNKLAVAAILGMTEALVPGGLEAMMPRDCPTEPPSADIQQQKIEAAKIKRERKAKVLAGKMKQVDE